MVCVTEIVILQCIIKCGIVNLSFLYLERHKEVYLGFKGWLLEAGMELETPRFVASKIAIQFNR